MYQKFFDIFQVKSKMKSILIIFTVVLGVLSEDLFLPGELTAETYFNNRIASGETAKKGENLDFCYLNVQFNSKSQLCGCAIISKKWLATSGRCLYE